MCSNSVASQERIMLVDANSCGRQTAPRSAESIPALDESERSFFHRPPFASLTSNLYSDRWLPGDEARLLDDA